MIALIAAHLLPLTIGLRSSALPPSQQRFGGHIAFFVTSDEVPVMWTRLGTNVLSFDRRKSPVSLPTWVLGLHPRREAPVLRDAISSVPYWLAGRTTPAVVSESGRIYVCRTDGWTELALPFSSSLVLGIIEKEARVYVITRSAIHLVKNGRSVSKTSLHPLPDTSVKVFAVRNDGLGFSVANHIVEQYDLYGKRRSRNKLDYTVRDLRYCRGLLVGVGMGGERFRLGMLKGKVVSVEPRRDQVIFPATISADGQRVVGILRPEQTLVHLPAN